jgi:sugar lactone lactonase YvrE
MCFDALGRCIVCCFDVAMVYVVEPDGGIAQALRTGEGTWPTNCVIAPDGALLVTEARRGTLLRRPMDLVAAPA